MITALYSDQLIAENAPMDRRLAALILSRGNRIGYIASAPEPQRAFFDEKRQYYARYGLSLDLFVDLDALAGGEEIGPAVCLQRHPSHRRPHRRFSETAAPKRHAGKTARMGA